MKKAIEPFRKLYRKQRQLILYVFFGVCTTAVNTVCYGIFHRILHRSNLSSTILAWLAAVLFAFLTNRLFVFESKRTKAAERLHEAASFFICRILTGILDVGIMAVAVDYMHRNSLLWKLLSNCIVTAVNYLASKWYIFKR